MNDISVKFIKLSLFFFNFLFWLSGSILIIVGAIIRKRYGSYFSYADYKFAVAELCIIVVGVIVFFIGFLGCCGAVKENYCVITTFSVLLSVVFVLEVITGAVGFAYKESVKTVANMALKQATQSYYTDEDGRKFLDFVQQLLGCCGSQGPKGYDIRKGNVTSSPCGNAGQAVASCHQLEDCGAALYKDGCRVKFAHFIQGNLLTIGAVGVGVAFVQLLGIVFACFLMKVFRKGIYKPVKSSLAVDG